MLEPRSAIGIAHAASQIAVVGDLQDGYAGVLLVVRAQPAVHRTTLRWLHLSVPREASRQGSIVAIEPIPIAADEILSQSMFGTPLAKVHPVPLGDDLGLHHAQTIRTQTLRAA